MTLDSATADRLTSFVLFSLGVAMLIGGYTMDRLEIRHIHPASIPGLVPMILGAAMMLCAMLLFLSSRRNAAEQTPDGSSAAQTSTEPESSAHEGPSVRNLVIAGFYSVVYALGLVGNMPFAVATAVYIAVFYLHFTWRTGRTVRQRAGHIAFALAFAVCGAFAISSLFEHGFLVRLP